MSSFYNRDDIRTSIEKDIAINTAYVQAWEKVTFPTKKDGKPFSAMSKNIDGAKYEVVSYAMQPGEYELTVYTHCIAAGYIHDTIKVYELVRYLKDPAMIAKTENYLPKASPYLEQVYKFDLEDVKAAVNNHIEYLTEYVNDLKKQLASLDKVFTAFRNAYNDAMKTLENETACFSHKDLYYAVRDCVKERYPYV